MSTLKCVLKKNINITIKRLFVAFDRIITIKLWQLEKQQWVKEGVVEQETMITEGRQQNSVK